MFRTLRQLIADERGQGLAEYGLILGLVAVVCISSMETLGTKVNDTLTTVGDGLP